MFSILNAALRELKDHIECTIVDTAVNFNDVRLQFECFIQEQKVSFLKEKEQRQSKKTKQLKLVLPIPVVRVLVEGDINSIEQIVESVKRNIPVIIVKGSGKVTNLILDYMESPKSLKSNASLLFGIGFRSERFRRLREGLKELKNSDHL
ncbi:uncharacterized protein LOC134251112, partial [Saccostrea cucullata]|uniref:uncharacterized protein LOC134251112 n=1 Tax=Saccostrea cuccullata TaxID=36930 RepID=UPI002ED172E0